MTGMSALYRFCYRDKFVFNFSTCAEGQRGLWLVIVTLEYELVSLLTWSTVLPKM